VSSVEECSSEVQQHSNSLQHFTTFRNADSVRVVNSSTGSGLCEATKYISCIFEAKFFISDAIKSATVLAHRRPCTRQLYCVIFTAFYATKFYLIISTFDKIKLLQVGYRPTIAWRTMSTNH